MGMRLHAAQHLFIINLWAGIDGLTIPYSRALQLANFIIGPYLLLPQLEGRKYLISLQEVLPNLLDAVPPHFQCKMFFQQCVI